MNNQTHVSEKIRNLYNRTDVSEWRATGAKKKLKNINSVSNTKLKGKILEVGCGDGALLNQISNENKEIDLFGLEITDELVDFVNNRGISALVNCKLYDGYTIPYEDNYFDFVILSHVVEHLEFPRKLIYEAKRVGKVLFLEVPLELTLRLKNKFQLDSTGHINFYSIKTFELLLGSCDLKITNKSITNPSKGSYRIKGIMHVSKFWFRQFFLFIFGKYATKILTYYFTVSCIKD